MGKLDALNAACYLPAKMGRLDRDQGWAMFGRKKSPPPHSSSQSATANVTTISMIEAYGLAHCASLTRGLPVAGSESIAWRVLWLEQRGLPGVFALTREYLTHGAEPFGGRQMACPIIFGARIALGEVDVFPRDAQQQAVIPGITNALLVLPCVAKSADRLGEPLVVNWRAGEPVTTVAATAVTLDRAETRGNLSALLDNTELGFARLGEPLPGHPPALATTCEVPTVVFDSLTTYIGPERLATVAAIHQLMTNDPETLDMLRACSAADLSVLEGAAQVATENKGNDTILLTTSPGSPNDRLWSALQRYGWTTLYAADDLPPELRGLMVQHVLRPAGCAAVPLLIYTLAQFQPTRH
jgi:hypothetical protein